VNHKFSIKAGAINSGFLIIGKMLNDGMLIRPLRFLSIIPSLVLRLEHAIKENQGFILGIGFLYLKNSAWGAFNTIELTGAIVNGEVIHD
jgi:hypothetical protein